MQNVSEERKRSFFGGNLNDGSHLFRNGSNLETKVDMKEETTYTSSQEDLKKLQNDTILKRIPANSEATTVLVCKNNNLNLFEHKIFLSSYFSYLGWLR